MSLNKNPLKLLRDKNKNIPPSARKGITTFLNPYSYLFFRKNLDLFTRFDYIDIDGQFLAGLLNLLVFRNGNTLRKSFDMTSIAPLVFKDCEEYGKSIYFVGSTQENIEKFVEIIQNQYSKLKILGFNNGYLTDSQKQSAIKKILRARPDYVVVGMGTPLQEKFLSELKEFGFDGQGYTCGGFVHQTAKRLNYYPRFYDKYNFRWIYRIIDEPKLIKRYLLYYPLSFCLFIFDTIKYHIGVNN